MADGALLRSLAHHGRISMTIMTGVALGVGFSSDDSLKGGPFWMAAQAIEVHLLHAGEMRRVVEENGAMHDFLGINVTAVKVVNARGQGQGKNSQEASEKDRFLRKRHISPSFLRAGRAADRCWS